MTLEPTGGGPAENPAEDPAENPAGEGRTGRPDRRTAALLLLLCAALALALHVGLGRYADHQTRTANRQATAAAARACVNFASVSAASVDADLHRILAGTTGDLRAGFSRDRSRTRAVVVENDVRSHATALSATLLSGDRRRATVLVAVDATVRTAKAPEGRRSQHRIQVDLVRVRDRWLVSRLQVVA